MSLCIYTSALKPRDSEPKKLYAHICTSIYICRDIFTSRYHQVLFQSVRKRLLPLCNIYTYVYIYMYLCRYTFATSCFAMRLIVISANRWFRTLTPRPHETIDSKLTERQATYATKVLLQSSYVSEWILISNTSYRGSSNTGFAHYNVFLRILLLCRHEGIPAQHVWQKSKQKWQRLACRLSSTTI